MSRTRLTVEPVPRTCWFKNVRSEVSPDEWNGLRRETLEGAGYRCAVCGVGGGLECHETWEYDDDRRVQRLAGLVALCDRCHEVKHFELAGVRGNRERAVEHLARVNGWSRQDAELYIEAAFETWHRRSAHEWALDITWLGGTTVKAEGKGAGRDARPAVQEGGPTHHRRRDRVEGSRE